MCMCMDCTLVEVIAYITTCIAIVVNVLGVFTNTWWLDLNGQTYGMFTVVNCTDDCVLGDEDNEAWMVLAQVTSLVQLITLIASLVIQLVGAFKCKYTSHLLNLVVLGISLFFSLIHIFLLVGVYTDIMDTFHNSNLPSNFVYFQTLPAGLNAIAGTITIPPFATMIVLYCKERKSRRDVVKEAERQREESFKKRDSTKRTSVPAEVYKTNETTEPQTKSAEAAESNA